MKAQHPEAEYAVWTAPGAAFTVSYWLSLFHEIDFQVNEGYRRIPHGGIEIGGLLFGNSEETFARVEAFRTIACEHLRGPSFVLSERDLEGLRGQLASAPSDPELAGLQVLGWFIAHTRSQLEVNERETALFDEFFPGPGKLMMLIKPERFQPTRFAFLVRGADGKLLGGEKNAVILPLPGRAERAAQGPMVSIPAPVATAPESRGELQLAEARVDEPAVAQEPKPAPVRETPAAPEPSPVPTAPGPAPPAAPMTTPLIPEAENLPSIDEIRRRRAEAIRKPDPEDTRAAGQKMLEAMQQEGRRSNARLAVVLFIAAALGCVVGYFIYLQLPPAVIPLNVEKRAPELIVSWPREQTRDAGYAALRVDDGDPIVLSREQKKDGEAAIHSAGGNVKIELIAQHWMRDSHGILRYVEPLAAAGTASQ